MAEANMICPKCGTFQPRAETCAECGVVVEKFRTTEAGTQPQPVAAAKKTSKESAAGEPPPLLSLGLLVKVGVVVLIGLVVTVWGPQFLNRDERELENTLRSLPFYPELAQYEPDTYEQMKRTLLAAVERGEPPEAAIPRARHLVTQVLVKYLPQASDDAVWQFGHVMIDELDELSAKPAVCYALLFPQNSTALFTEKTVDLATALSRETQLADLRASAAILRSASENPQPVPDPGKAEALLMSQAERLHSRYGDDVALLGQTVHSEAQKPKICRMYRSLMQNVMRLEKTHSSMLLRHLLALAG